MRYALKMICAFIVGMVMVVQSAELAADGKWVSVCLLGVLVFGLFAWMAYSSVVAEREAGKQ